MKLEYLIFNCVVFFGPLILSRLPFFFIKRPDVKKALVAISIPAFLFLIWDWAVIDYFWWFNESYITGLRIFNIPIEEILFFLTVSYSCLFLWENWKLKIWKNNKLSFKIPLLIGCIFLVPFTSHLHYTFTVLLVFIVTLVFDSVIGTHLFNKKNYIYFLGVVLLLTLISNGYLTARPIVLYNDSIKTNILITTIPVEDFVYGLALISLVIILYEVQIRQKR